MKLTHVSINKTLDYGLVRLAQIIAQKPSDWSESTEIKKSRPQIGDMSTLDDKSAPSRPSIQLESMMTYLREIREVA